MKKRESNLDEMQELKLLQIEHTGFWMLFWGLAAVIYIQSAMGHNDFRTIGPEALLLIGISIYELVRCIQNGIWDRKLKPDGKTNLMVSLAAGVAVGLFWGIKSYVSYHKLAGSLATFLFMSLLMTGMVLVLLLLSSDLYKKRKQQMDEAED